MSVATDADRRAAAEMIRCAERDARWLPRNPTPLLVHRIAQALADQRDRAWWEGYEQGQKDEREGTSDGADARVSPGQRCASAFATPYGDRRCDLTAGHDGLHIRNDGAGRPEYHWSAS